MYSKPCAARKKIFARGFAQVISIHYLVLVHAYIYYTEFDWAELSSSYVTIWILYCILWSSVNIHNWQPLERNWKFWEVDGHKRWTF